MKIFILLIACIIFISCQRRIANYKVTPNGYKVYKRTKPTEPTKDIFSNGDTLVVTAFPVGWKIIPRK